MAMYQTLLEFSTHGQGLYEFTDQVAQFVQKWNIETGLLTLFCRHTSCSLLIQENADPDVRHDLDSFFARLVPEGMDWVTHTMEGPDDMPAHIKTALTATSLNIPVMERRLVLGTWQGVYLFEHRVGSCNRQVVMHLNG